TGCEAWIASGKSTPVLNAKRADARRNRFHRVGGAHLRLWTASSTGVRPARSATRPSSLSGACRTPALAGGTKRLRYEAMRVEQPPGKLRSPSVLRHHRRPPSPSSLETTDPTARGSPGHRGVLRQTIALATPPESSRFRPLAASAPARPPRRVRP